MREKSEIKTNSLKKSKGFVDKNPPRILLAEDEDEMRVLLGRALRKVGYRVIEDYDGESLYNDLILNLLSDKKSDRIDMIISDIKMPGPSVMEMVGQMNKINGFPPVILITAFGDEKIHAEAKQLGVTAVFNKPFDIDKFIANVMEII